MKGGFLALVTIAVGMTALGCGRHSATLTPTGSQSPTVALATAQPADTPTATPPPTPVATESPTPEPTFSYQVAPIDQAEQASMIAHKVWHQGCPVGFTELRLVTLSYWGFDRVLHSGQLVVNVDAVDATVGALRSLFGTRFPIEQMQLVDVYEGNDDASMAVDNTSTFNCRLVPGTGTWSQHAYGRAIDVNPLVNPEVENGQVYPPEGARYADRSLQEKGMIHAGDVVVQAFEAVSWHWGGYWDTPKDYQHFSQNGL